MPQGKVNGSASNEELAQLAAEGCSASFELLVRRFQTPLLHFLRQRTANPADAEDLAQDTFVRAYENLHQYKQIGAFSTWLFTIARRLSINHYHKKRPRTDSETIHVLESTDQSAEQTVADGETKQRLWAAARELLDEQQTTALWLYYVDDMSVKQVAAVVERSVMAVKMMLFRARKKLTPVLEKLEAIEPGEQAQKQDNSNPPSVSNRTTVESTNG